MIVTPIKTDVITAAACTIEDFIDAHIENLHDGSIVVVTSKVVSLCENAIRKKTDMPKADLIKEESQYVVRQTKRSSAAHNTTFTVTNNLLIPSAGVDESNSKDVYVLWPRNPQKSANRIRAHLTEKFQLANIGVIITDSTCSPMRRGTTGVYIAHSGFRAIHSYVGEHDLFGRPFKVSVASVAGGIAASAVVVMGEGAEQTPIAIVEDVPFVVFQPRDPSQAELDELRIDLHEDLFAPFLTSVEWERGGAPSRRMA